MSNVSAYSQTAASNNAAPPNGWPEGQAPSTVNDCAREMMAGIARWYAHLDASLTTTGSSNVYVLSTGSSHAALADIGVVVFKANHANTGAATIAIDGLSSKAIQHRGAALVANMLLANQLYAVAYNTTTDAFDLLSTPAAINALIATSLVAAGLTYPTTDGTSGQYLTTNGAGVLSFANASQNITRTGRTSDTILAAGDKGTLIDVTSGTFSQTITVAATLGSGWYVFYQNRGTGVVTLDPNGTETINGSTTRLVYPGESLLLICDGSNFWEMAIEKRAGTYLIQSQTASNSATIDFTGLNSDYDEYEIHLLNVVPATDGAILWLRTSTDGGSTYDSGATDYDYFVGAYTSDDTKIVLTVALGSDVNETGACMVLRIANPSAAQHLQSWWSGTGIQNNGQILPFGPWSGRRKAAANVDAIRFLFDSGNIESGIFKLYGVRK